MMLIIYSILALVAFVIMSLYENQYAKDGLITKITVWLKILILIPLILVVLLKSLILFQPLIITENSQYFDELNYRLHHSQQYQITELENDLDKNESYYFFQREKNNNKWSVKTPLNCFSLLYSLEVQSNSNMLLYLNADSKKYDMLYILNADIKENTNALAFDIPVNKFKIYSSEFDKSTLIKNLDNSENNENLIFYLSSIFIFIYIIIKNIPPKSFGRIIMILFMLIMSGLTGVLVYRELLYFWVFRLSSFL